MEQKLNSNSSAGAAADSDMQPMVIPSADIAVNPMLCVRAGEDIGVKDANGNDIFIGSVIDHRSNLYVVKFSKNRKEIVARKEPLKGQTASWRDIDWIKRCSPYIKIVGTVLFDEVMAKRFKDVLC